MVVVVSGHSSVEITLRPLMLSGSQKVRNNHSNALDTLDRARSDGRIGRCLPTDRASIPAPRQSII